jgi:hypothetical protein
MARVAKNPIDPASGKRKRGRPRREDIQAMKEERAAVALAACTPRQAAFVKGIMQSVDNGKKSNTVVSENLTVDSQDCETTKMSESVVRNAGYAPGISKKEILNSPKIRSALVTALEARGVTDALLAEVIEDGLTAREDHKDINSKPERTVRHKYLETALKLRGDLARAESGDNDSWESRLTQIIVTQNNVSVAQSAPDSDCTVIDMAMPDACKDKP